MTDKEINKLLEKFINNIPPAKDLKITITSHSVDTRPKDKRLGANYNDVVMVNDILKGATYFMYWLKNNYYSIKRRSKCLI